MDHLGRLMSLNLRLISTLSCFIHESYSSNVFYDVPTHLVFSKLVGLTIFFHFGVSKPVGPGGDEGEGFLDG